jgi:predicted RNA binding protein YcfA (HicA-like mRNA interferase family)
MSKRRLFSSDEIINALLRCGFEFARRSKSGHQTLKRQRPNGRHDVTVVPLGEKEIPKGTFDNILKLANLEYDDFLACAKIKRKGRKRKK